MQPKRSLLARALAIESYPDNVTPEEKATTVVMNGPLSIIMSRALDVAFSKEHPLTGQPAALEKSNDAEQVEELDEAALAVESQAIDHTIALAEIRKREGEDPEEQDNQPTIKVFTYGTGEKDDKTPEPIEVFREVASSGDVPIEVIMVNTVDPVAAAAGVAPGQLEQMSGVAIESVSLVVKYRQVSVDK